jgi:hypothetical protein
VYFEIDAMISFTVTATIDAALVPTVFETATWYVCSGAILDGVPLMAPVEVEKLSPVFALRVSGFIEKDTAVPPTVLGVFVMIAECIVYVAVAAVQDSIDTVASFTRIKSVN